MTTTEPYVVPKSRFIREYRRWRHKILAGDKVYVTRCGKDATLQVYLSERDYVKFVERIGNEFDDWCREKRGKRRRYKVQPGINKGWDDAMDRIEGGRALDDLTASGQKLEHQVISHQKKFLHK